MIQSRPRLALALMACGMFAATADAQSKFARALPADTLAFFSFPDITKSIQDMQSAPIAKMWHEGEVQDFLGDAINWIDAKFDENLEMGKAMHDAGHLPFDPNELMQLRLESLSFALTKLDIQKTDNDVMPNFGVIMHADLGQSARIWKKALTTALEMLAQQAGEKAELTQYDVGEAKVYKLAPTKEGIPLALNLAFTGNAMVMGTLQPEVQSFLTALDGNESHLAASASYMRSAQRLTLQDAEAEMYVRPGGFIDFAMNALRVAKEEERDFPEMIDIDGIDRAIAALGLRSIKAIGATTTYANGRCESDSYTVCPKDERRGLTALGAGEIDMSMLRWVPKDAASLSIGAMNVGGIYSTLVDALNAYDKDFAEMALGRLGEMEKQVGMSIKNDIFGAFGDRYISWQLPMASFTSAPEMAIICEMKNKDGLLNALKRASEMSQGMIELEENERRGIKVYQLLVDYDFGGGGFNPLAMFTPTFSFKDDYLVLAFSTGDIKRAFKRMAREDNPKGDIRTNAEFAPYLESLPKSGITSLSFRDWKAEFESYYQIGTTFLAFVPLDDEIPIDLSLLPDASTLTQHLCGSVTWAQTTDTGMVTRSIGPWGPETVAILCAGIAGGAATFAAMSPRGF